jgi:hypothetical protein
MVEEMAVEALRNNVTDLFRKTNGKYTERNARAQE